MTLLFTLVVLTLVAAIFLVSWLDKPNNDGPEDHNPDPVVVDQSSAQADGDNVAGDKITID